MTYIEWVITTYKSKGVIVDTNLWLLLLIGAYDIKTIPTFKRTQSFIREDFDYLNQFLAHFSIIVTPNIFTELSNLTDSLNEQTDGKIYQTLYNLQEKYTELYIPSVDAMDDCYIKFGLTDSVIYQIAKEGFLVLTDDLPLYGYLINKEITAINFNHIRTEYLLN